MMRAALVSLCVAALLARLADGYYLPGIAPVDYEVGSELEIYGRKLYSLKNSLSKDYYAAPFCATSDKSQRKKKHTSLGALLEGERKELTAYAPLMGVDMPDCQVLCIRKVEQADFMTLAKLFRDEYNVRLSLDNLPLVIKYTMANGEDGYDLGYPLVSRVSPKSSPSTGPGLVFNNHLSFTVLVHRPKFSAEDMSKLGGTGEFYRIVGFEANALSKKHVVGEDGKSVPTCANGSKIVDSSDPLSLTDIFGFRGLKSGGKAGMTEFSAIVYSYDITFKESPIKWATRWDHLLKVNSQFRRVQWFSIINSSLIVLFLSLLVALVLLRTVWRDFARYNNLEDQDELREESGWKLIHADVFRSPFFVEGLAVFCGTGMQLLSVFLTTMLFALLGFFSPANRGGLLTGALIFYALASCVGGFVSARLYSFVDGTRKNTVTWFSGVGFTGLAFGVFFAVNVIAVFARSTNAVPFLSLLLLLAIWFGVAVPLAYTGAYVGYKLAKSEVPCRVNSVPREIPKYSPVPPAVYVVVAGLLPFGVIFIQLVFILNSIWQEQLYYMFGFLFVVFVLLSVTASETSIVLTYLTLVAEDYHWWWKSFFASGSVGLYIFVYSIIYLVTQPVLHEMHGVSILIYLAYTMLVSLGAMLLVGSIGFYSSFYFVHAIYSRIHVD